VAAPNGLPFDFIRIPNITAIIATSEIIAAIPIGN
jgi:hypothetical protein